MENKHNFLHSVRHCSLALLYTNSHAKNPAFAVLYRTAQLVINSYGMYATYTLHSWQLRRTYATYMLLTKSLCQEVCHIYVTCRVYAVFQCYFLTYLLFVRYFEFPSLSLSNVVYLTTAEYHKISYSQEKTWRC